MDLKIKLASFSKETKRLEAAYIKLQNQFYQLKSKLEESHQTLELIITHMSDGLIFVKNDGEITLFNQAAASMLGLTSHSVLRARYDTHFSDAFFGFSMNEALMSRFTPQRIVISLNDEKEVEVSTSAVPEKGIVLLLTNRTEQQKLQKSLGQAERLKEMGEMAATLAHEIRNPLGGIEGFARLLERDLEDSSHQHMVRAILAGTCSLNRLVSEVLDYARPLHMHFATVDMVALIHETIALAQAAMQMPPKHDFLCSLQKMYLSIDREKIQRVLLNILRNACEAEATALEITLSENGRLRIKDNGRGIEPKNLEKIFTPFFTTKTQGSGLGLAHSLAIVKAHDGTLEISSKLGIGTEINIKL